MTLVLLEKGLVLEGSTPKIEDKQVQGSYFTPISRVKFACIYPFVFGLSGPMK